MVVDMGEPERNLLILKNAAREGPGLLAEVLRDRGIGCEVVELERGDRLPGLDGFGALVVLGGPASANDGDDIMRGELALIRDALDRGLPCLGICLGLQALVKAGGGGVMPSPSKEIGFRGPDGEMFTVELTEEGRTDPLFRGLDGALPVFQLHSETVELTPDMQLLASGRSCRNQVVRAAPRAYGIQCHFELTPEMLGVWMDEDPGLRGLDAGELLGDFRAIKFRYNRVGRRLLHNFLELSGLL
jgi:GMP synthase (glutamine-hydrolysing)